MNKLINLAVAGISVAGTLYMRRQFAKYDFFANIELPEHAVLTAPDVRPGPWFCYYLGDYMTAHPGESVVYASPLELGDGSFAWATNTPEWDKEWFEARGHTFPEQWLPYSELAGLDVQMVNMGGLE